MKTITILVTLTIMFNTGTPYNGYWDSWGNWVPGLITNDTWMTPAPTYVSGKMVFYGPWAMDATAEYRGIDYKEENCIGGVTLMSPYDIGSKVWVRVNSEWYGPFCDVDCAKRGDMYSIIVHRGEAIEVNFDFAKEMGMVSEHDQYGNYDVYNWYLDVEVLVNIHPSVYFGNINPYRPISYKRFFLNTLKFTEKYEPRVLPMKNGTWKEYGDNGRYWFNPSVYISNDFTYNKDTCKLKEQIWQKNFGTTSSLRWEAK